MVLFIAPVFWRPRFEPGAYRGPQATPPFGGLGVVNRRVKWEIYPSRVVATPLAKLPKTYQNSILPKNIVFILKQSPTQTDRYRGYLVAVPTTGLSQFQGYWCQSVRDLSRSAPRTTRAWLSGTAVGAHQRHGFPSTSCAVETCLAPMSKPSLPSAATSFAATGKARSNFSTARSVTRSAVCAQRSARPPNTSTQSSPRLRTTSRRKTAFLLCASISVSPSWGANSFIGMPGKPAPEPTSASVEAAAPSRPHSKMRAANSDSPKCRVTIFSGSRTAVRFTREFQRSNRSR